MNRKRPTNEVDDPRAITRGIPVSDPTGTGPVESLAGVDDSEAQSHPAAASGSHEIEECLLQFEREWQQDRTPDIPAYLERLSAEGLRRPLLLELVCLDLEYCWRTGGQHSKPLLGDYLRQFPELGSLESVPLELIVEEYRVRHRWGDVPSHDVFVSRFTERQTKIRSLLRKADLELDNEQSGNTLLDTAPSARTRPSQPGVSNALARLDLRDYLLQRVIGVGQMGKVYRAWHTPTQSVVAVKYLRKAFLEVPGAVARFVREAEILAGFRHPGIVRFEGLGRTPGGGYFIAMELAIGGDLAARVAAVRSPVHDALRWIAEAAGAIAYSHRQGILHCDLKPANFLLRSDGSLAVSDFGLARSIAEAPATLECVAGTAPFMAPEQVSSYWGPLTERTDVYGLGAVLYSLLTGRPPHSGATLGDTLAQVVSGTPVVAPTVLRPELARVWSEFCLRCLAKSPADRFENVGEVEREIERLGKLGDPCVDC